MYFKDQHQAADLCWNIITNANGMTEQQVMLKPAGIIIRDQCGT